MNSVHHKPDAIELKETFPGRMVEVHVTGAPKQGDVRAFTGELEHLTARIETLGVVLVLEGVASQPLGEVWSGLAFSARRLGDMDRLAIVVDPSERAMMAGLCMPAGTAEILFFPPEEIHEARRWAHGCRSPSPVCAAAG